MFLKHFTINSFRGLREVALNDLGWVNIFVGRNNSGKTSVLESLYLFQNPMDTRTWLELLAQRNGQYHQGGLLHQGLRWLAPVETRHQRIEMTGLSDGAVHFEAAIQQVEQLDLYGDAELLETVLDLRLMGGGHETKKSLIFNADMRTDFSNRDAMREAVLLTPMSHRATQSQIKQISHMKDGDRKAMIQLMTKLDPAVNGIEIGAPDGRNPVIFLRHQRTGKTPLTAFGDGIRRAFSFALHLPFVKGGALFIDEVESSLHVDVLCATYQWLIDVCRENNTQLFLSTHSLEAVDALLQSHVNSAGLDRVVVYRLQEAEQGLQVKRWTGDMSRRLIFDRGLDVR